MEREKGCEISIGEANTKVHRICSLNGGDASQKEAAVAEEAEGRRGDVDEGMGLGVVSTKVMTDEQLEALRRQIAVYATICEKLVEMHKAVAAQQDSLAGLRFGGLYADSLMGSGGHKIAARHRWTPTSMQLQILEKMFDQGHGTPSKHRIKEITLELTQYGQISETNVYNWFQNRRARSKRKQTAALPNSNTESDVEAEDESSNEKKSRRSGCHQENVPLRIDDCSIHNPQTNSELHSSDSDPNQVQGVHFSNESSRPEHSSHVPYIQSVFVSHRVDHLMGSFSPFHSDESCSWIYRYNNLD